MTAHHIPDSMLLDYAAGTLPVAVDILVATHLSLCPHCRRELAMMEEAAGAMLDSIAPVAGDDEAGLARLLGILDDPLPPPTAPDAPFANSPSEDLLPAPLRQVVGPSSALTWRTSMPGAARRSELNFGLGDVAATLEEVRPGQTVPSHGHEGIELTMVLAGGYSDKQGHFLRGDVQVVGPETIHAPLIDDEGVPCILLSIRSAARVPDGLAAHIASWLGAI